MDGSQQLNARQLKAIPHLIAAPTIEEGCKRAGVSKAAVYEWLKDETFRQELKRQRKVVIESAPWTVSRLTSPRRPKPW